MTFAESFNRKANDVSNNVKVVICSPAPYFHLVNIRLESDNIALGGQNSFNEEKGAFTGEISNSMLLDLGCEYVILGHSERRSIFNESDELINKKVISALEYDLNPILCIGETEEENESGKTFDVLKKQLDIALKNVSFLEQELIIAYEPVWAIGTGKTPTNEDIAKTHDWIRNELKTHFSDQFLNIPILYGGSLNDKNCDEILKISNVNGGLVGGASLVSSKFKKIIDSANKLIS